MNNAKCDNLQQLSGNKNAFSPSPPLVWIPCLSHELDFPSVLGMKPTRHEAEADLARCAGIVQRFETKQSSLRLELLHFFPNAITHTIVLYQHRGHPIYDDVLPEAHHMTKPLEVSDFTGWSWFESQTYWNCQAFSHHFSTV